MREERLNFELQRLAEYPRRKGYNWYYFTAKDEERNNGSSDATKVFMPVLYDAVRHLTEGYAVLYGEPFACRRRSRKRIFGGRWPARFKEGKKVVRLAALIKEAKGCVSAVQEYEVKDEWFHWENKRDCKALFLLQNPFDVDLLNEIDDIIPEVCGQVGWNVAVYNAHVNTIGESAEQTIERYRTKERKALFFGTWSIIADAEFFIDPKLYPEEKLIDILKAAVEKHGYELEILPPMRVEEKKQRNGK